MWHSRVIETMAGLKVAGVPFELAWRRAMVLHPPRRMDMGPDVPTLFDGLDFDGPDVSLVDFLHDACADAWHGRRAVLRGLVTLQLTLTDVDSRPEPRDRIVA
jgi:hypothetical protein